MLDGDRPLLATVQARAGGLAARLREDPRLHLAEVTPRTRDQLPQEFASTLLHWLEGPSS